MRIFCATFSEKNTPEKSLWYSRETQPWFVSSERFALSAPHSVEPKNTGSTRIYIYLYIRLNNTIILTVVVGTARRPAPVPCCTIPTLENLRRLEFASRRYLSQKKRRGKYHDCRIHILRVQQGGFRAMIKLPPTTIFRVFYGRKGAKLPLA